MEQRNTHQVANISQWQQMALSDRRRMAMLMTKNTEGQLNGVERDELARLVAVYEQIMINNSEALYQLNSSFLTS